MTQARAILRTVATILTSVATSLAPFYGKDRWYVIAVAVAGAVALAAPSLFETSSSSPASQTPAGTGAPAGPRPPITPGG